MTDLLVPPTALLCDPPRPIKDAGSRRLGVPRVHLTVSRKWAVILADAATLGLAGLVAIALRGWVTGQYATGTDIAYVVATTPVWLATAAHKRLFTSRYISRSLDEIQRVASTTLVTALVVATAAFTANADMARGLLGAQLALGTVAVVAERGVVRVWYQRQRMLGRMRRPVLVAGTNREAIDLAQTLRDDRRLGYEVVGLLAEGDGPSTIAGLPVLGTTADAADIATRVGATGVLIATTAIDPSACNRMTRELLDAGVHVELSSTLLDIDPSRMVVRPLGRYPVVFIEPVARSGWRPRAKRCFDVVGASVGLLLTAPLLAVAAVAIRLDSGGPVLFRQSRVGKDATPFTVLKLRTMVVDAESRLDELRAANEADGPLFKMGDDPRVTRVGRLLRAASIDELPQLFNVLRGEMSLVGPRPALPREMGAWSPELLARNRVQPGLTGLWQVSGRSDTDFATYSRLDLYYVDNWSIITDLGILLRTLPAVMARKGAR